jgi:hypothetical protein
MVMMRDKCSLFDRTNAHGSLGMFLSKPFDNQGVRHVIRNPRWPCTPVCQYTTPAKAITFDTVMHRLRTLKNVDTKRTHLNFSFLTKLFTTGSDDPSLHTTMSTRFDV